jgi:hypothetical protein
MSRTALSTSINRATNRSKIEEVADENNFVTNKVSRSDLETFDDQVFYKDPNMKYRYDSNFLK